MMSLAGSVSQVLSSVCPVDNKHLAPEQINFAGGVTLSAPFATVIGAVIAGAIGLSVALYNQRRQRDLTEKTLQHQRVINEQTIEQQRKTAEAILVQQQAQALNQRFATAAEQLGNDEPALRMAGIYAMAGLADDWEQQRQVCIDVLCGFLRITRAPTLTQKCSKKERLARDRDHEVRQTAVRVIKDHLQSDAITSWSRYNFDFTGVAFDEADFENSVFNGGQVSFRHATFNGFTNFDNVEFLDGPVLFHLAEFNGPHSTFNRAEFSGARVSFLGARFKSQRVTFDDSTFTDGVVGFWHCSLAEDTHMTFSNATFSGTRMIFDEARFYTGDLSFLGAKFVGGEMTFRKTVIDGDYILFFNNMSILGGAIRFDEAMLSGGVVDVTEALFDGGTVDFSHVSDWSAQVLFDDPLPPGLILPSAPT